MSNTPEHDKRRTPDGEPLHPDVQAAYDYMEVVVGYDDRLHGVGFYGYAVREAFLAGISHAEEQRMIYRQTGKNPPLTTVGGCSGGLACTCGASEPMVPRRMLEDD